MPNNLPTYVPGGTYFFTVALSQKRGRLFIEHIHELRSAFRQVKARRPFKTVAFVILPDHIHCIWTLPPDDTNYSERWRLIKIAFSKSMEHYQYLSGGRLNKRERSVWQHRFREHFIQDQADFNAHLDYIHFNPVKHGLANRAADWPYSSFHLYANFGMYPPEWVAPNAIQEREPNDKNRTVGFQGAAAHKSLQAGRFSVQSVRRR